MAKTHGTMDQFEAQVRARIDQLTDSSDIKSASDTPVTAAYDGDEMNMKQFLKWLSDRGIDVSKHNYELKAESYDTGRVYTYRFRAPGDWVAYLSMRLHKRMTQDEIMYWINDEWIYDENYDKLFDSVSNIRDYAAFNWWGDGSDFIYYLKNLDTGEMLYEAPNNDEPEYAEDQNGDEEYDDVNSATNTCGIAAKPDVVQGTTYYVDTQGMLGEPGQQYDYDQLWDIWDDNHEDDPVMNEYDSFDYWLRDTVKWFDVVEAATGLDSIPDELTVTIEGSTLDEPEDQYNERYVHSMIPEIQSRASEVADVHDVYIDGTDLVCRFDDFEDLDKEIRVPLDDLTLVWSDMDGDIDYIVDKICYDGRSQYDFGEVPMPEPDDLAPIDECNNPIMSSSIPYGEYGQMLIDDEEELRAQYDEGELAPSDIVESLGYVAQDDHVYIKDLGDGCNMVFDFTKYNMSPDDECIQHYFTDETGRVPRGYTVTKMYL